MLHHKKFEIYSKRFCCICHLDQQGDILICPSLRGAHLNSDWPIPFHSNIWLQLIEGTAAYPPVEPHHVQILVPIRKIHSLTTLVVTELWKSIFVDTRRLINSALVATNLPRGTWGCGRPKLMRAGLRN